MPPKLLSKFKLRTDTRVKEEPPEDAPVSAFQEQRTQRADEAAAAAAEPAPTRAIRRAPPPPPQPLAQRPVQAPMLKAEPAEAVATATPGAAEHLIPPVETPAEAVLGAAPEAPQGDDRGTDFLRQEAVEVDVAAEHGRSFFPSGGFDVPRLAWMQLPLLPAAPALSKHCPARPAQSLLESLPPGKCGKLRVHRSGRVTLLLETPATGRTVLDVVCHSDSGSRQSLVAVQRGADGEARCYDLGPIQDKLVSVPNFDHVR